MCYTGYSRVEGGYVTRELKALAFSMCYNFIITVIKIFGGCYFQLGSLVADGMHTMSDFITDLVSFIGVKLSKKRPTKAHPFGFGKVEYLTNLFMGMLLVVLAIYIVVAGFLGEVSIPSNVVFFLLLTVFVLKLVVLVFLFYMIRHIHSQVLFTSFREAKADLYSTVIVFIVVLLLKISPHFPILEYADVLGSIVIGLMIFHLAISIIIENSLCLLGEAEVDSSKEKAILDFIQSIHGVKEAKVTLIKYGDYYKIHVLVEVEKNLSLRQITNLEHKLKRELVRHRSFHVKYPSVYITTDLEKE